MRFYKENGIQEERTVPRISEQNAVSERMNQTLLEKAWFILEGSQIDKRFAGQAERGV